jgi:histidine triad (HIT) family protein
MSSLFSQIISGKITCYKVDEDEEFLAFLDINPIILGHTLVIPKIEIDYIFDLDDELLSRMMVFSKKVALKLKSKIECKKIGIAVIGLEVPHAHIHLVPMNQVDDLNFSRPKLAVTKKELVLMQKQLLS